MTQMLPYVVVTILFLSFNLLETPIFASRTIGIMIPLYTYPGTTWDTVVATKNAHPSVPIVAIINPNNGPGDSKDTNYVTGIQKLQSAGVIVIGYVQTNYAMQNMTTVQSDVDSYKSWYPQINGIFFDEMSNKAGDENYYQNLSNYAKSVGFTFTVGNPGTETLPSYVGTMDNIIIYDNYGMPNNSAISGWYTWYDKSNFSFMSYGVEILNQIYVQSAANYVEYIYVSDDIMPNPWDSIPVYFDDLVDSIEDVFFITVNSTNVSTNPVIGIWNEIYSNNTKIKSGFTPIEYGFVSDLSYTICIADYQNYIFDHWENGNTDRCRTLELVQNVTLTAHYVVYSILNLHSVEINGIDVSGMWTEIYSNGTKVQSGFTPQSYSLLSDSSYIVCIADYQNYIFDHWENGNADRCRILDLVSANTTITAHYIT